MNFQFIICTYNNEEIIEDCLISIKKLNREKSWKFNIMLVDDNSYDSTISVARAHNKDITTIALFDNYGPSKCRNIGYKHSKIADYFVFMDSDVILDEDFLIEIMKKMRGNVMIAGPKLLLPDETINAAGGGLSKIGIGFDIGYKKHNWDLVPGRKTSYFGTPIPLQIVEHVKKYNSFKKVMYICSAAMVAKAGLFKKIGVFDETYFYGHEDTDLGWRANLAGYDVVYVPKAKAIHKKSQTVSKDMGKVYYNSTKNRVRSIIKNYSFYNMVVYTIVYTIISFGDLMMRPYKKEKIAAWWWLLTNLGSHFKERKKIQALRKRKDSELPFGNLFPES